MFVARSKLVSPNKKSIIDQKKLRFRLPASKAAKSLERNHNKNHYNLQKNQ